MLGFQVSLRKTKMGTELLDGTIVPGHVKVYSSNESQSGYFYSVNDYCLRSGIVISSYDPDDDLNRNKKYIEYDVEVKYANSASGYASIIYPRCKISSLFGSIADYFRWVPRIDNTDVSTGTNIGSQVLLLCVNGNNRNDYIIGGMPNLNSNRVDKPFDDHSFDWEYNGVYVNINLDGEIGIYRKGATDNTGATTNAKDNISTVLFDKDGKINIWYMWVDSNNNIQYPNGTFTNKTPFISLDQQNNAITINGNTNVTATATGTFQIKSGKFKINSGSEALLNATTYRQQQQQMNQQITTSLESLISLITTAGISPSAAGAAMIIPVVGAVAAAPFVATAGIQLTSAVALLTDIMAAIQGFEALSPKYLSNNNFQSDN